MEKLMKLILSFVIVCTMLSPMSIKAQSETMPYEKIEFQTIEEFVEPNEELRKTPVMPLMEKTEEEILFELEDLIKNALLEGRDFVDISHLAIERKSHSTIDYYKSFSPYISGGVDIAIYYWDNFYTTLSLTNTMSIEETKEYFDRVDAKIEEIMQVISPEYSDEENALRLHDYLVFNYEYDTVLLETQETEKYKDSFRSGGIIMNGVGVCQAYAFAYKYFLNKIGMDCMFYPSNVMGHVWNIVTIDGELYHVDATFDDPITDQLYNVSHRNFLNSTARMLENGYHSFNYPEIVATSTKYDNSFYKNIKSQIIIDNNDLYYITNEGLYKSNEDGTNPVLIDDLGIWETNEGGYYTGKFASLFLHDRKIYYNTQSDVYSYDLDTKQKEEVYELDRKDKRIYGVINKNGVLYVNLVEIPGLAKNLVATDIIFTGEYIEVEKVIADKQEIELFVGEEDIINVSVLPQNATNKTVTYTSSDKSVVSVSDGKLKGIAEGEATITIASSNNKTASVKVYVKKKSEPEIIVNKSELNAKIEEVQDTNADKYTLESYGIFAIALENAKAVLADSKATQEEVDKTLSDLNNAYLNLKEKEVLVLPTSVSLNKNSVILNIGETIELKATVLPENTSDKTLSWKLNNEEVVSITNGKVTALKAGSATIVVETVNGKKATCSVIVNEPKEIEPTHVILNEDYLILDVGEVALLTATVLPENAENKTLTFLSSDEEVVKVINGKVEAVGKGETTVTVKTHNGITATCNVTVNEKIKPAKNGWEKLDGKWYFFIEDVAQTGWVKDAGKWYFMDQDGVMQTGWIKDNNKWYYLNTHMLTGWQKVDGQWYYLNSHMMTGWLNDGGKWYYLDSAMKTGWQKIDGKWYYLNTHMLTGWQKVNGTWYYLNSAMVTGWLKINNTWYYFNSNGAMVTGIVTIDGKVQKFNSNGAWLG